MPNDGIFKFPEDFLAKIDSGAIDDEFIHELGKLTDEKREELGGILIEQKTGRGRLN